MKSAWFKSTLLTAVVSIALFACKDDNKPTPSTPPAVGGKGGLATMRVIADANGIKVDSGKVYIKYDAVVIPANNQYDDSAKIIKVDGIPMAIFTELKEGNYFLYIKGWDIIRSQTIWGNMAYTLPASAKTGLVYVTVPVRPTQQ